MNIKLAEQIKQYKKPILFLSLILAAIMLLTWGISKTFSIPLNYLIEDSASVLGASQFIGFSTLIGAGILMLGAGAAILALTFRPAFGANRESLAILGLALISLYLAYLFYIKKTDLPGRLVKKISGLYTLVYNKYLIDEAYDAAIVRPLHKTSESFLWRIVDNRLIDGLVNAVGAGIAACGRTLTVIQTGSVQHYALWFVLGAIVLLGAWLF